MAIATAVTSALNPLQPVTLTITGGTAGQVFTVFRVGLDGVARKVPGQLIADGTGTARLVDRLYRLDEAYTYEVRDSTATTVLAMSAQVGPVPSGGNPWITDVIFPEALNTPVWIVDVSQRVRPGRITTYTVVGRKFALTTGDIRSGSNGLLTLLTRSHTERDRVISVLSTGNPCMLRVPAACRVVVDEMVFTPRDVDETRLGTRGASTLDVDFVEVDLADIPAFAAVTYASQTTNADAASMTYAELTAAFVGRTYVDLYLSPTGVAP